MSRTRAREIALHLIYETNFHPFETDEELLACLEEDALQSLAGENPLYEGPLTERQRRYILETVKGVLDRQAELDEQITNYSKGWSLTRITRISRAILRLAIYEMYYVDDVPVGAAINEAVELAKAYDSEEAGKFVNGILGTVGRTLSQKVPPAAKASAQGTSPEEQGDA